MTYDSAFARQIGLLAVKIIVILLLSNAGQTFFVYQNF
jgi:hypothetical protein